ncbi:hypothetical protein [Vibrio brasiliensis]|uniref:hypothetical protein n=1 Tax=Vibrio brasiliensis TaxID=170652 RepID=UPI001EFE9190|nr:hypothetical protein [Vibrio brasiliensis]MCG9727562.1 hypothetical protein [Vibrio brasiliensis]
MWGDYFANSIVAGKTRKLLEGRPMDKRMIITNPVTGDLEGAKVLSGMDGKYFLDDLTNFDLLRVDSLMT